MTRDLSLDATPDLVGDDTADWLARAEVLCRLVARRDLAHVPLYIVPQSRLPSVWGTAKHCHAYTTPSLDLYFRDHMRSWRGRGPCMLINDRAVCEDTDPAYHDYRLRALVLHELAHILDRPALYEDRSGEDVNKLRFEACPPSTVYRVRKFARRHRVAACSCSARRGRCCGAIRKQGC